MNILFRCDGSVEIGIGHVVRCLALADHLQKNGNCNIQFAMRKSELEIKKVKKTYPIIRSNEKFFNYVQWLSECIVQTKSDILIMDMRDGLTRKEVKSIKKKTAIKIVTIDDLEDKRMEADLAFYPPVPQLEKVNWDGFKGKLYIGWEYVILRKEFLKQYPKSNNAISNILISMGGTDEKNMTEFVINSLNEINEIFKVIIIIGDGYPYLEKLKKYLEDVHFEFALYKHPKNIAEVMSQADFAIISFGQTAYELAALKIPSIYICITTDHYISSKLFMNVGIGISLGLYSKDKKSELIKTIMFYIIEKNVVKEISNCAKLLDISDLNKISKPIITYKL